MKEKVKELQSLLSEILKNIGNQIEVRQIDLNVFDAIQKSNENQDDDRYKISMEKFRDDIIAYKEDTSLFDEDIPHLETILTNCLEQLKLRNSGRVTSVKTNIPNQHIIELIKQRILSTDEIVRGYMNGKEYSGHLTEDGFLEITTLGFKRKYGSLRSAAFELWGRDNPSQWKFWKVNDQPLEYYRRLIK